ncbi:hypothetical protein MVES1_000140 [Malassezia vespertilionis]|uniref:Growth hormone-inducible transmembrane protein n=1 Tax=Malassezia vespertilionis TaxID=2020962 RepID=A0A2N1JHK0_9BASI|nr:uncharacterized protein MVES1_000140 [Malassezia vespertilionis]PKI86030.1 hypothetical protein MVES_000140 [Malassezia vespertilionis]WFD04816.1 hypothetical protein MVES1_000140 [Malassezia vespertilionis]
MFSCAKITTRVAHPVSAIARQLSSKTIAFRAVARPGCKSLAPSTIAQQVRTVRQNPFQRHGREFQHGAEEIVYTDVPPHEKSGFNSNSFAARGGWPRALASVGIVVGTAIGANLFFNRDKRGQLSMIESNYLNSTFTYLGGGLTLTGATAYLLHRSGFAARIMLANPWLVLGVGLVTSIASMLGAQALPPGHPGKVPCWILFNISQGAALSPLLFLNPALLARAGLYTAGVMGSLCYVGATAKEDKYLYLGGPLLAGVTVVALTAFAPLVLPRTMTRTLIASEAICLYGGLAVFGAFVLWDTQKILQHARMVQAGMLRPDPLSESIGLELDFINIFTRIVQILAMRDQRRK